VCNKIAKNAQLEKKKKEKNVQYNLDISQQCKLDVSIIFEACLLYEFIVLFDY